MAKRVCGGCEIRLRCLEVALEQEHEVEGIWGGTSRATTTEEEGSMSTAHYTIRGSFTDKEYLVVVEPGVGLVLHEPGRWGSGSPVTDGLWWRAGGGRYFRSKSHLLWQSWLVEYAVARREARLRREWKRTKRAHRFAERRRRG